MTAQVPGTSVPRARVVHGRGNDPGVSYRAELVELVRVIVVGAVPWAIVCTGGLSRLAMFVLRETSPTTVLGTRTDDGFVIGEVTLSGSYNLAMIGVVIGMIGGAAYVAVSPWLIGPQWFRSFTVATTAALIAGSAVITPGGPDFSLLEPTMLAIGLFVAIPFVYGLLLVPLVDAAARAHGGLGRWVAQGRRRWLVPLMLVSPFPAALPPAIVVVVVIAILLPVRRTLLAPITASPVTMWAIRATFLVLPVLGAFALASDVRTLT